MNIKVEKVYEQEIDPAFKKVGLCIEGRVFWFGLTSNKNSDKDKRFVKQEELVDELLKRIERKNKGGSIE